MNDLMPMTIRGIRYNANAIRSLSQPLIDIIEVLEAQNRPHHAASVSDAVTLLKWLAEHTQNH